MSTQFKPGDEVQFTRDDDWHERKVTAGTRATFIRYGELPHQSDGLPLVALEDGFEFLAWDEVIEPYKGATPLDPSKVKAGDTVTLTRGKAVVTDEVAGVSPAASIGNYAIALAEWVPSFFTEAGWTLTDHQPSPEPEPSKVNLLHDYLTSRGDYELLDGLVVIDPASDDLRHELTNAVSTSWTPGVTNGDVVDRIIETLRGLEDGR